MSLASTVCVLGRVLLAAGLLVGAAAAAAAQCAPVSQAPGGSIRFADAPRPLLHRIASPPGTEAPEGEAGNKLKPGTVELTFVGHASFVVRSVANVTAVTDYNDYVKPSFVPEVVTMNNAHSTHFTDHPDPGIKHVLRGWAHEAGKPFAEHNIVVRDMRIRNVPTNVRDYGGTRFAGNSIFVFETANLCIAHLGHLHHTLTETHLKWLGQIDVLLVPVDGGYTLAQELMVDIIEQIRPSLVIPMHYFSSRTLARFLALMEQRWPVKHHETPTIVLSRQMLPHKREILVLPGN